MGPRLRGDDELLRAQPPRAVERLVGAITRVERGVGALAGLHVAGRCSRRRFRTRLTGNRDCSPRLRCRSFGAEPTLPIEWLIGAIRCAEGVIGRGTGVDVAGRRCGGGGFLLLCIGFGLRFRVRFFRGLGGRRGGLRFRRPGQCDRFPDRTHRLHVLPQSGRRRDQSIPLQRHAEYRGQQNGGINKKRHRAAPKIP